MRCYDSVQLKRNKPGQEVFSDKRMKVQSLGYCRDNDEGLGGWLEGITTPTKAGSGGRKDAQSEKWKAADVP